MGVLFSKACSMLTNRCHHETEHRPSLLDLLPDENLVHISSFCDDATHFRMILALSDNGTCYGHKTRSFNDVSTAELDAKMIGYELLESDWTSGIPRVSSVVSFIVASSVYSVQMVAGHSFNNWFITFFYCIFWFSSDSLVKRVLFSERKSTASNVAILFSISASLFMFSCKSDTNYTQYLGAVPLASLICVGLGLGYRCAEIIFHTYSLSVYAKFVVDMHNYLDGNSTRGAMFKSFNNKKFEITNALKISKERALLYKTHAELLIGLGSKPTN